MSGVEGCCEIDEMNGLRNNFIIKIGVERGLKRVDRLTLKTATDTAMIQSGSLNLRLNG